jgi:branched-chain amino acid transport system ATP-binding protein
MTDIVAVVPPVIAARNISAGYGNVPAITDLTLEVRAGELVALLGPNGAGKTTALLSLIGECSILSGTVEWKGSPLSGPLQKRARRGLAFVRESRSVFVGLSALDNLRLGRGDIDRALELFPELKPLLRRRGGLLSGGEQQMLTLARALSSDPDVLLVDEVSLGLAPIITQRLMRSLREAADRGTAVIMVEQHVRRALTVSDRVYVLRRGRVVLEAPAADVRGRVEEVERYYLSTMDLPVDDEAPAVHLTAKGNGQ